MKLNRLHILLAVLGLGVAILAYRHFAGGPAQPKPEGPMMTATCTKCGHKTRVSQAMLRPFLKSDKVPEGTIMQCEKCRAPAVLKLDDPAE